MRTLSRVTQRPSGVNVWQQPAALVAPRLPARGPRSEPEEVHAASKRAASARISSFSNASTSPPITNGCSK